jgi:hypothetical protein
MEFKGTKGEWKIQEQFDSPNLIVDEENNTEWYALSSYIFGNDKVIGETRYGTYANGGYLSVSVLDEMRANAKLIAAAPELLKALQSLQSQFKEMILDEGIDVDEGDTQAFNQATEAINKALN